MTFPRLRVASSKRRTCPARTPDKFWDACLYFASGSVWLQRCGTVIEESRGMAELLGARIFLEAMRETRHGRIRKQQVNRDRYTASSEKLISVVHSSQMQHTEHKTQRKNAAWAFVWRLAFVPPLSGIYIYYPEYYCLKFKQLRGCVYSSIILHTDPQVCPRPELNSVNTREFCTTSSNGKEFMFNYVARVLISTCCFYISNNQNMWYSISNNSRT